MTIIENIMQQARESWDYLDSKILEAKITNTKKSQQFELEDKFFEEKSKLLTKNNHKEFKTKKQRIRALNRASIDRIHNPNIGKYGLYRLQDTKEHLSVYQQDLVSKNGIRVRTTDNKTKWALPGISILFKSKVEFLGAINNQNIPYFKYRIPYPDGKYLERYEGDIDIGNQDTYNDIKRTFIKNTRNTWKKWFKNKVLPYAPNYASNEVIGVPKYNNIFELLMLGTPEETGVESVELITPDDKVVGFCESYDTLERAIGEGYRSGSKFFVSNEKEDLNLTWKDGKHHKEKYAKRGWILIILMKPKDIYEEVLFTDARGNKKSYYSQNIKKSRFTTNEMMLPLGACAIARGAKAISYNAPLCKKGYTLYDYKVLDFDTIAQNYGVIRNIDKTCKKNANSTFKEMQPAIMGLGGNFIPAMKICAYYLSHYYAMVENMDKIERFKFICNLATRVSKGLDALSPKPFRIMDSGILKLARILNKLFDTPEILHEIGTSLGSLIRNASRLSLDLSKTLFQFIRNLFGYTTDGTKDILVFVGQKIKEYTKFLNAGIADTYFALYESYKNISIKEIKVGWQKRQAIVYLN